MSTEAEAEEYFIAFEVLRELEVRRATTGLENVCKLKMIHNQMRNNIPPSALDGKFC